MRGLASAIIVCAVAATAVAQSPARKKRKPPADYRIKVAPKLTGEVGKPLALSLTIAPQPGYTISRAGPLRIRLTTKPKQGLQLKRRRYRRKHAADKRADSPRFDLHLLAKTAGSYQLRVALRFWVCGKHTCRPVRDQRTVKVNTAEPPPPATQPAASQPTPPPPPN